VESTEKISSSGNLPLSGLVFITSFRVAISIVYSRPEGVSARFLSISGKST